MPKKRGSTDKLDALLASVTDDMLGDDLPRRLQDEGLKVERILLDLVRPDPVQPRRVLPDRVYQAFHNQQLTPSQALRELIQTAQLAARQQGRPFSNIVDLLGQPDDERNEDAPPLTAEEQLIYDLANLAVTIRDNGQVNPLTVVDVSQGVTRLFRIETGERRYWATWLLRDFVPGYEHDGMIPCIVIPPEQASAFRQAKENTARTGLSAIAMARQAALLILMAHGHQIPEGPVPADFYRQALDLTLRGKREYTAEILSAMGGITRKQLSRFKGLLRLCDEALEIADRNNIDEARLRYVCQLAPEDQVELIRQIIQFDLSRKQVHELIEGPADSHDVDSERPPKQVVQLAKLMKRSTLPDATDLARFLVEQEDDVNIALARIHSLRQLLDETEKRLIE